MESPEPEEVECPDLVEEAVEYLTDQSYPGNCSNSRKRQNRKKTEKFVLKDGQLHLQSWKGQTGITPHAYL